MAGSPGAGKTEASKSLLETTDRSGTTIRIDPDELREQFEGYTGENSWLFQPAVAILVEKIHDNVLKNGQNFLLDGTFSSLEKSTQNVTRSLKRGRFIQILYVYQDPVLAWEFVVAREKLEGRRIMPDDFVSQYFGARRVVNRLKGEFGRQIVVDLLLKNRDNSTKFYKANIDRIDNHVPERYTEDEVRNLVNNAGAS
jgi:predicted ABC-type ATPase